ncbi:Calreticulin [Balamuthia mandrillaris]
MNKSNSLLLNVDIISADENSHQQVQEENMRRRSTNAKKRAEKEEEQRCHKLLNKTIELVWIDRKGWLADLLTQRLEKMGIHLVSDKKKGCSTFAQRVKKSRFNCHEFLIVLEHAEEWLFGLEEDKESDEISKEEVKEEKQKEKQKEEEEDKEEEEKEKEEEERKEPYNTVEGHLQRVRTVWRTFHRVCTLAMQENVCITEERWKEEARKFLFAFLNVWPATNITTYIHIFVDHLGYWLEKEGCVEMFSNFPIESTHNTLQRMVRESTQGFSGKNTGDCLLPKQLLEKRSLETTAAAEFPVVAAVLKSKTRGEQTWSERNLKYFPDLKEFLKQQQ